ncbi:calcium-binding protein [Xanthobacter sp. KR7-65]|uniref:beta strand repeat-containing protein n=1 Tax=Xanthobacter sp. KR7-65 TaxID=3156612 RepID=UPI0032B57CB9
MADITGTPGNDTLTGTDEADTIQGLGGDDEIFGLYGKDNLYGGEGNDNLVGADSNDLLDGGTGDDRMEGNEGSDTYIVDSVGDVVVEAFDPSENSDVRHTDQVLTSLDSYTLGEYVENLTYTGTGSFTGNGNALANVLTGGAGIDTLAGGANNDTYVINRVDDVVIEAADNGTDTVIASFTGPYTLGANLENFTYDGSDTSPITLTGNELDNAIRTGDGADVIEAMGGNDTVYGLLGDDTIYGGDGNDRLYGGAGNDFMDGGAGVDRFDGSSGDDTYVVGAGDTITEYYDSGIDTVLTDLSSYTLVGYVENLTYTGTGDFNGTGNSAANIIIAGSGNDTIYGMGGSDTIYGMDGDDLIHAGDTGANTLVGGAGNDTYYVRTYDTIIEESGGGYDVALSRSASYTLGAFVQDLTFVNPGASTGIGNDLDNIISAYSLSAYNDTLKGKGGNDTIYAFGGDDVLDGGDGNDTLDGGTGNDQMTGGSGNDVFLVDAAGDVVIEAAGGGTDTVRTSLASHTLAANVENLTYTGAAAFAGTGNSLANVIRGGAGNDTIDGGAGNDTMYGGLGDDLYFVDAAGDVVIEDADAGIDSIRAATAIYTLGTNVENLAYIGSGNFSGTGNTLANVMAGGAGNDSLVASAGNDTLSGNAGDDYLDGGTGADAMTGGTGNDVYLVDNTGDTVSEADGGGTDLVRTSLSSYTLAAALEDLTYTGAGDFTGNGNASANVLTGGTANDTFTAGAGNDTLYGRSGNDWLDGGTGSDALIGGTGDDVYLVDSTGDAITEYADGGNDTVRTTLVSYTLAPELENLVYTGTGGANFTGTGNAADNSISGGKANDTLDGGAGNDALAGGLGNDTYIVDAAGDVVTEAANAGTDTVRTSLSSYALGANVENVTYTGTGDFTATGNTLDNTLKGAAGNDIFSGDTGSDTLYGLVGDDWLDGGAGSDWMEGGAGNDTYVVDSTGDTVKEAASAGTDTVRTTLATYTLGADFENLVYTGTGGANFTGTGNALDNSISGGKANDTLDGGLGNDSMAGGLGNDTYFVDAVGDGVSEAQDAGIDSVRTSLTTYTLGANVENVTYTGADNFSGNGNGLANALKGGAGDDTLYGGAGNDTLYGLAGTDTLAGGSGADLIYGGGGADQFVYSDVAQSSASAFDTIADFSASGGDIVNLAAIDANSVGGSANDAFVYVGSAAFSGTAGELRFADGQLQGDTNGDGNADLVIALSNTTSLSATSLKL